MDIKEGRKVIGLTLVVATVLVLGLLTLDANPALFDPGVAERAGQSVQPCLAEGDQDASNPILLLATCTSTCETSSVSHSSQCPRGGTICDNPGAACGDKCNRVCRTKVKKDRCSCTCKH